MNCIETKSKRHPSTRLAAGLAVSAFLLLGAFVAPASADNNNGGGRSTYDQYDGRSSYGYGQQQYYRQPSNGYGQQQYYRQPSYGYGDQQYNNQSNSGVGIYLPGIGIRIQ